MKRNLIKKAGRYVRIGTYFFFAAFILIGCAKKKEEDFETGVEEISAVQETNEQSGEVKDHQSETEKVFVYICGQVQYPGVYELDPGARIFEAIQLAGGVTDQAAPEAINQAKPVTDGEQIYIPSAEELQIDGTGVGMKVTEGADNGKININTAGKEELMTLAGIGEAKALSILNYREEHGKFESVEQLMEIEGIKEGVFNKIKQDITI